MAEKEKEQKVNPNCGCGTTKFKNVSVGIMASFITTFLIILIVVLVVLAMNPSILTDIFKNALISTVPTTTGGP